MRSDELGAVGGRLSRLQAVTAALSGAVGIDDVASVVLEDVVGELGAGSGALWLLDPSNRQLELTREVGLHPDVAPRFAALPLDADLPGPVATRTRRPVIMASRADRDEQFPALRGVPTEMEAIAVLPLVLEGQAMGVLAFGFPDARTFSQEDRSFLSAIGHQCAIALDRARLHAAERELRLRVEFVADAAAVLTGRVDREEVVARLAELAVPRLADWCTVFLADGDGLRRVVVAGEKISDELRAFLTDQTLPFDADAPVAQAFRTGEVQTLDEISDDVLERSVRSVEAAQLVRELGVQSGLAVPLISRGQTLGILTLVFNESGRVYDEITRTLAEDVASRAAMAIQQAIVFEREHAVVMSMRSALFPRRLPDVPGVGIVARYLPASEVVEIGGDWWDVFSGPDGSLCLAVGDVGGHGEAAVAAMAELRTALRAHALEGASPAEVIDRLSRFARRSETADFATVIYVEFDPTTGQVRWTSAGHPPALVLGRDGCRYLDEPKQPVLGVVDTPYTEQHLVLSPGDRLVLYSDGLVEGRTRHIERGLAELADVACRAARGGLEALADQIEDTVVSRRREDDVSFLLVERAQEA